MKQMTMTELVAATQCLRNLPDCAISVYASFGSVRYQLNYDDFMRLFGGENPRIESHCGRDHYFYENVWGTYTAVAPALKGAE